MSLSSLIFSKGPRRLSQTGGDHRLDKTGLQQPNETGPCDQGAQMAIALHRPPAGCIQHTDRGSQYYATTIKSFLASPSRSRQ